MKEKKGTEL